MKKLLALLFIFSFTFLQLGGTAFAVEEVPSPIIDNADVFSPEDETRLYNAFKNAYDAYGVSTVIETIDTLGGQDAESFALVRANELGVGDADKDNGLYLLFVKADRYYFMQPGQGVERFVSQGKMQQIVDNVALPSFKQERYTDGVIQSVSNVAVAYNNGQGGAIPYEEARQEVMGNVLKICGAAFAAMGLAFGGWFAFAPSQKRRREDGRIQESEDKAYELVKDDGAFAAVRSASGRQSTIEIKFLSYNDPKAKPFTGSAEDVAQKVLDGRIEKLWMDNDLHTSYRPEVTLDSAESIDSAFMVASEKLPALLKQQSDDAAEAERVWQSLSDSEKAQVRNARTRKDKERVLGQHGSNLNTYLLFYFIYSSHAGEVGQPMAPVSTTTSSSSSYSSSSFGGGSFSGGGAGGGW